MSPITYPCRLCAAAPTGISNPKDGTIHFTKPQDNAGNKTFPNYSEYADAYIYDIALPGTEKKGRVFVGQRKDPFVVNLGETFDLINLNPLGAEDANTDSLAYKNVTAICLEVPKEFLLAAPDKPIIGAWSTASSISTNSEGAPTYQQLSRLSMPLVNELVIGLKDKNAFNASEPKDDLQFVDYITHPTLPALINILFSVPAPEPPRNESHKHPRPNWFGYKHCWEKSQPASVMSRRPTHTSNRPWR